MQYIHITCENLSNGLKFNDDEWNLGGRTNKISIDSDLNRCHNFVGENTSLPSSSQSWLLIQCGNVCPSSGMWTMALTCEWHSRHLSDTRMRSSGGAAHETCLRGIVWYGLAIVSWLPLGALSQKNYRSDKKKTRLLK